MLPFSLLARAAIAPLVLALLPSTTAQSSLTVNQCLVPGTVALTIDDGPWIYLNGTLDILKRYNAKATFFVVGRHNSKRYGCIYDEPQSAALRRAFAAGHQIGSLTWSHPDLLKTRCAAQHSRMA